MFMRNIYNRAREGLTNFRTDDRKPAGKAWDLASFLIYVAIIAGICWLAGAILLFVFPAKWTFLVGLIKVIKFLGKWVFWITSIGALICYIVGWILPIFTKPHESEYYARERAEEDDRYTPIQTDRR